MGMRGLRLFFDCFHTWSRIILMKEIELSTMVAESDLNLAGFQEQTYIHPRHQQFDWVSAWNKVLQIGLYQKGPDISEVGSTWLDNLKEMRALRPFSADGGYVNFTSEDDADRAPADFGANYARLREVKAVYDPENVFRLNQNVIPA